MPGPIDASDCRASAGRIPQSDGARDESMEAWFAFRDHWTPILRSYFRWLPCTRAERDELVMDVLVDGFAAAHEASREGRTEDRIRTLARLASAQYKRLVRHEVQLQQADEVPGDDERDAIVAERERLSGWLEQLLERLPYAQRVAIERHFEDASDDLIAKEIGRAVASVPVLRARGMRQLRRMVAESPPPPRHMTSCRNASRFAA